MTDSRLEKIRALIATAESFTRGGNHAAAASYNAKAQELMTKWSIEEAQLAGARSASSTDIGVSYIYEHFNPYQEPKLQILYYVANHNNCRVLATKGVAHRDSEGRLILDRNGRSAKHTKVHVIGRERDRQFVEMLYTSLLVQLETEILAPAIQERMAREAPKPGNRIKWRNSFVLGYGRGVDSRLQEAKRTVVDATPGAALVLADSSKAIDAWIENTYSKLRKGRNSQSGNGYYGAQAEGAVAGRRADVGQTRVGNDNRKALR